MSLYTLLGVMSGTSMDGIDIVSCSFESTESERYTYTVNHSKTYDYSPETLDSLRKSIHLKVPDLLILDKKLGNYFADCILDFIETNQINKAEIHAIASHGHTIFHQPEKGFTLQIGCGDTIAYRTGIRVINDFRQKDVIAGGQGAPLVPIGDKMLYSQYAEGFLNIGGFCNISIPSKKTIAFDICPGNLPLNEIAAEFSKSYDEEGIIARSGTADLNVLMQLNALNYFFTSPPKSLGTEWLTSNFKAITDQVISPENRMRTIVEHISDQIAKTCQLQQIKSIYITGGGAYNIFLIERIKEKSNIEIIIPNAIEIEFKEAIIFGLLGALYLDGKTNTLASVTGATQDVIGGVLHLP